MRELRIPVTLAATAGLIVTMGIGGTASGRPQAIGKGSEVVDPGVTSKRDADFRPGAKAPTAGQRDRAAKTAGSVRWNRFGTPSSLRASTAAQTATAADPAGIAKAYLAANNALYKLSAATIEAMDVLVSRPMGKGSIVVLRQRFGGLPAGSDGLATLGISGGKVVYVSSSLVPDAPAAAQPEPATLDPARALDIATVNAGLSADKIATSRVTLTAVPLPAGGARTAYQVVLLGSSDTETAFTTYVDARSGDILLRDDLVDHDSDNPEWAVFPANPPADGTDSRVKWCLVAEPGCERTVSVAGTG